MRLRGLSLVVLLAISLSAQTPAVASSPDSVLPPHGVAPTLLSSRGGGVYAPRSPRVVDVRAIAKRAPILPSPASGGGRFLPQLPRKGAGIYASGPGPHAVEAATIFAGLSLAQNQQLYGQDQSVEPADAQIAASPSALVEVAGNTMALFSSDGSLQWTVDIQALFQLPAGYKFYAPSLQYDWGSGRWFLGGIASNTTAHNSWLLLAVSRTGNPFGTWSLITTDARSNNLSPNTFYFMRESIAVVADKVVQATQINSCTNSCDPLGAGTFYVMRKDQLVAGVQPAVNQFGMGYAQTDFLAVQPQSVGGTYGNIAFLVWLKRGSIPTGPYDRIGLLQVTGLPYPDPNYRYLGTTVVWEKDFSAVMPPASILPAQPGGTLSASPTPITSAIYRDGKVVMAMNDNCGATPDPRQVYCVRIIKITNFGNATPVANSNGPIANTVPPPIPTDLDLTLGRSQANLFDASLAIDPFGRLFVSAAFSSPDVYPGMAVTGIGAPIGSTSTVMPTSSVVGGPGSYNCFAGSGNRWGAYMRSVPDPNNWTHVWMPGEFAAGSCWATAMVSATMGIAPWPVTMTPALGSINGSQTVEIDGSYFVPDADQVLFGSTPGIILSESPTAITVVTPPGVAGPTPVTVLTPDGTASAGTFTYITPGVLGTPPVSSGGFYRR